MSIIKNYQSAKSTCKVTFTYPLTEGIGTVQVLGDFNDWDSNKAPKMKKGKSELSTIIELATGKEYQFRYLIDGNNWANDDNADKYVSSPFYGIDNSVIILDTISKKEISPVSLASKTTPKKASSAKVPANKIASTEAKITKSSGTKVVKETKKTVDKTSDVQVSAPKVTSPKVTAPKSVKKVNAKTGSDDLKKIEGIGPKIAEILNKKGILTFADLSKQKVDALKSILDEAGSRFNVHDPSTWPTQASMAATGKWDELKKLQDELNAGKVIKQGSKK